MDLLYSIDIFLIIIDFLPIHDIRNFLRCNKKLNLFRFNKNILSIIDINSLNWEKKLNSKLPESNADQFIHFFNIHDIVHRIYPCQMKKYALEIVCYGYIHLLPKKYELINNILFSYRFIYLNAGYNNFFDLTKFLIKFYNSKFSYTILGASMNGNLKMLKLIKQNNYILDMIHLRYAAKAQQLCVLKWAKINGYIFQTHVFDHAIKNKYLHILKWACKNNFIDENIYQQAILN